MAFDSVRAISIIVHNGRQIPRVPTELDWADSLGSWKVRWAVGRMKYTVEPGLYGVGEPTAETPVFVTANYKMSFDRLRSGLTGRDGWILVLDTKGINVWCAAGKGTFVSRTSDWARLLRTRSSSSPSLAQRASAHMR